MLNDIVSANRSQHIPIQHWNFWNKKKVFHFVASSEKHPADFFSITHTSQLIPNKLKGSVYMITFQQLTAVLFARDWFDEAFIAIFSFQVISLLKVELNFALSCSYKTWLRPYWNSIILSQRSEDSMKKNTKLSSIAHGFLTHTTSKKVTDLHDIECWKNTKRETLNVKPIPLIVLQKPVAENDQEL